MFLFPEWLPRLIVEGGFLLKGFHQGLLMQSQGAKSCLIWQLPPSFQLTVVVTGLLTWGGL